MINNIVERIDLKQTNNNTNFTQNQLVYNDKDLLKETKKEFDTKINTNITDYSIEDIFNILEINIADNTEYNDVKEEIQTKTQRFIDIFETNGNRKMVDFFKSIRTSLLGVNEADDKSLSEAEKLLISYNNTFDAEKNRGIKTNQTDTTDKSLYENSSGAGNPINRKTVTKLLNVDSRFRKNYSTTLSTDYKIDLPYPINNVIEMKLSDLEFPATYYPFTNLYENNYFWLRYEQGNGAQIYLYIFIPPGNYYHTVFISKIQESFDDLGVDLKISFNLSYDNGGGIGVGDGLVTIGVNSESNLTNINDVELNFNGKMLPTDTYNKSAKFFVEDNTELINEYYYQSSQIDYKQRIGWMLGFREPIYTGVDTYTSEGILDIIGPKYLYLLLDDYNNSSNVNFFNSSEKTMLSDNIIARISVKGYAFSIQSQTDLSIFSEPRYYYGPVDINKISIRLIDEYGRIVDLNNMDFSFTLSLITIYSKE